MYFPVLKPENRVKTKPILKSLTAVTEHYSYEQITFLDIFGHRSFYQNNKYERRKNISNHMKVHQVSMNFCLNQQTIFFF